MNVFYRARWRASQFDRPTGCTLVVVAMTVTASAGGCGTGVGGTGNVVDSTQSVVDGNRGSVTSGLGKTAGEPNDTFGSGVVAVFDGDGIARLEGTVSRTGDLDVFLLGGLAAGDRVVVDASTDGSALDISIAIFDDEDRLTIHNDDRTSSDLDSHIDWIVRHGGSDYKLVATNAAFADAGRTTGSYQMDVTVRRGTDVPGTAQQILLLDFDGGNVDSPALGRVSVVPFSAEAISEIYTGQTEVMKSAILGVMGQNFARFGITVTTSDEAAPRPGTSFTTIFFGGFDVGTFGIAESVDVYNQDFCDDAIIYAETFRPTAFSFDPSASELAIAIGNVASHEAGHLLGLNHVDDDDALMDDRSAADALLLDQEFMDAPLSSDIMSLGSQDAALLLEETVGLGDSSAGRALLRYGPAKASYAPNSANMLRKRMYSAASKGLQPNAAQGGQR